MNDTMLEIKNLHAKVGEKEILKGVDLLIRKGEIHAVMGPNGAGKSTLSAVLAGRPDYVVTEGSVTFLGRDLLAMSPEERSWAGIFLSFQYPVEIPGVSITNFIKAAVNAKFKKRIDILIDVNHYKSDRYYKLRGMAKRIGKQVQRDHVKVALDPMPNDERKVIHKALNEWHNIKTESEGEGSNRHVCISYVEDSAE